MSNKLSRFENEGNNALRNPQKVGYKNPNQFWRPYQQKIMQREARNEEKQPISPPMRDTNNNFQEDEYEVHYLQVLENINWMQD